MKEDFLQKNFATDGRRWTLKGASRRDFSSSEESARQSEKYRRKAQLFLPFLRFLPGVRAVAVVNTVAFDTATAASDIDLLVVAQKGRIWTARVFTTIFLQILGLRRHGKKIAGRFCLSFFVDEDNLDFSRFKLPFDPFLAFWCASLRPLFGRTVFAEFARLNATWVKKEVAVSLRFATEKIAPDGRFGAPAFLENFLRQLFLKRTQKKAAQLKNPAGTIVAAGILKFHDHDRRAEIAQRFLGVKANQSGGGNLN